jgi:hypothetical protein
MSFTIRLKVVWSKFHFRLKEKGKDFRPMSVNTVLATQPFHCKESFLWLLFFFVKNSKGIGGSRLRLGKSAFLIRANSLIHQARVNPIETISLSRKLSATFIILAYWCERISFNIFNLVFHSINKIVDWQTTLLKNLIMFLLLYYRSCESIGFPFLFIFRNLRFPVFTMCNGIAHVSHFFCLTWS